MREFLSVWTAGPLLLSLLLPEGISIAQEGQPIEVRNDNFEIRFLPDHAAPRRWSVSNSLSDEIGRDEWVEIIDPALPVPFIGGQWIPDSGSAVDLAGKVTAERTVDGDDQIVQFRRVDPESGLEAIWSYRFPRSDFVAELTVTILASDKNREPLDGSLRWNFGPGLGYLDENWFTRGSVMSSAGIFENLEPPSAEVERDPAATEAGDRGPVSWAGLHSRYYLFAIIGDRDVPLGEDVQLSIEEELRESRLLEPDLLPGYPQIGLRSPAMSIEPGASFTRSFRLFVGPKDRQLLSQSGVGLENSIFGHLPNWFSQICLAIYAVLAALHSLLGSWGLSIILMAIAVRICVFPLSLYGMRAQASFSRKQEHLKPLLAEIKSIHKGNSARINEEILKLYKKIGLGPLDPLKGILPLMIQLPILFAFYQLLSNSYDLKGVPFLWIDDLTRPDGLFSLGLSLPWFGSTVNLLPILMFLAHITVAWDIDASQHADDAGHRPSPTIFLFPLLMFLLFYPFPAGCMLYWSMGSILQVFEQRWCRASIVE